MKLSKGQIVNEASFRSPPHAVDAGIANATAPSSARCSEQLTSTIMCFRCGVCCTRYRVRPSFLEARRICDYLGLLWEEFLDKYVDLFGSTPDRFLLRQIKGACVFLEYTERVGWTSCGIHPVKPMGCREWTASLYRPACREGLAKYWGLTVTPSEQLKGADQKIRNLCSFIKSMVTMYRDTNQPANRGQAVLTMDAMESNY